MRSKSGSPTRGEVSERVSHSSNEMRERTDEATVFANDLDVVRHTLDALEQGGTQEGVDDVFHGIEDARHTTIEGFEDKSRQLDVSQESAENFKTELLDRSTRSGSDRTKISDAQHKVETSSARMSLDLAAQASQQDIQFLNDRIHSLGDTLVEIQRAQTQLHSRVHGTGRH
jgi:hypothetical protein